MKAFKFLFSGWLMGILLLVFAFAIGYATIIENNYGATAARFFIYNARWFEILLFLMMVNFTGMIFTKRLYIKSKWNILVMHLALIIIIIGAGITRYIGYEGQMHIRNGQTTSYFRSMDSYLQLVLNKGGESRYYEETVLLAPINKTLLSKSFTWDEDKIEINILDYWPNASKRLVKTNEGTPYLNIVVGTTRGREDLILGKGEFKIFANYGIIFGDTSRNELIQIIDKNDSLFIRYPEQLRKIVFPDKSLEDNSFSPLPLMSVHSLMGSMFLVKEFLPMAEIEYTKVAGNEDSGIAVVKISVNEKEYIIPRGEELVVNNGDLNAEITVGNRLFELPFALRLNKFELERYPGSNSPSSYASELMVIDKENNNEFPYRIYMNNILNYGGYRFFQSSYDQDEQGTILSVNKDYWGTLVTYTGYFLLFSTLIISLFIRKNRFERISMQLKDVHHKRKAFTTAVLLIFLISGHSLMAQNSENHKKHAEAFGQLQVQSIEGRVEPVNTLASKVLVKISKKSSYHNLTANQVLLGMVSDVQKWQNEKIIKIPESELQKILGIAGSYASLNDFINENNQYKISQEVDNAYRKKPALRSTLDKALINADERVNVLFMVLNGSMLRIFPIDNDPNNKWVTPTEFHQTKGHGTAEGDLFENYLMFLVEAQKIDNYSEADLALEAIKQYQNEKGASIMPSATKTRLEIFYNKANIFKSLFPVYLLLGSILIAIFFLQVFIPSFEFKRVNQVLLGLMIIAFVIQTIGLAIRWYISDHAPWSNGYESMIYIAWATILAGFIFMKKSSITLGVTAMLAGVTLLTAHMSWLNPELTNLVPVLKSHWLTIHVATITASYGFLGLGFLVAFLNLIIMIFRTDNNMPRVNLALRELSLIIEMSLMVGLVLLVIGNFLGGIWANESWGRYWGWDPKETWTLVTIVLYAFTLHMTLIPAIRSVFTFNFMALISFGAVLMTYFGVNYYLSGLHSYAGGDPVPIPTFVYVALIIIGVISILAGYNEMKYSKVEE